MEKENHGSTNQIERYEVETLWVKLGKYATSEGAIIRMDIVQGNTNETYNLKFTVNGSYISITDFISDIENDSTLGFKIEEFKMLPTNIEGVLQATFACKEIGIKEVSAKSSANFMTDSTVDTMNETNTSTNTTNTAGSTNTTNSTNSTNSTNRTNNVTANNTNTNNNTKTTNNINVSR